MRSDDYDRDICQRIVNEMKEKIAAHSLDMEEVSSILQNAFSIAHRKMKSMPHFINQVFTEDDWHQKTLCVFLELIEKHEPNKMKFIDYISYFMDRRLTGFQRELFDYNPPVEEGIRKTIVKLRRKLKRNPSPTEVSDQSHQNINIVEKIMANGFGVRRVLCFDPQMVENTVDGTALTPEDILLEQEANERNKYELSLLWKCIDKLKDFEQFVYRKKELEGISLKKLYYQPGVRKALEADSERTFSRRYSEVYQKVKNCVNQGIIQEIKGIEK